MADDMTLARPETATSLLVSLAKLILQYAGTRGYQKKQGREWGHVQGPQDCKQGWWRARRPVGSYRAVRRLKSMLFDVDLGEPLLIP